MQEYSEGGVSSKQTNLSKRWTATSAHLTPSDSFTAP